MRLIPEIAQLFCEKLGALGAAGSLAALSQTCSALHEPALDALWHELHDIKPLVGCMPHGLWINDFTGRMVC
jgi:hypothetical protein